ncbi:Superfamily I DNA and RNA helicases [Flavobacterium glycines]|uniref:DNA 3'-5' helicase II n=1 Tax=Flavobacterium glycines TaxID=551990 RepID=A0A1B9DJE9_9FLAO|nr:ATP-binding domain-containing protein [Flavobacterium glycines]OCB69825.1 hypothetical protein FBGL_13000 [Flavobacterium glycines]GEL12063.1 hypothetical protein FGL01_28020 [Flavobacterium glycines]SDJ90305.1 Superfamily I DNA and RNA helicases [Flavobacterium glycines]
MKINSREKTYKHNSQAFSFIEHLKSHEADLKLGESSLYYDFPIFKDFDGDLLVSQLLVISKKLGIIILSFDNIESSDNKLETIENLEQLQSIIFSRLLRNRSLRNSTTTLKFDLNTIVFNSDISKTFEFEGVKCISNFTDLNAYFLELNSQSEIEDSLYTELLSTIEGSKGIIKPKERGNISDDKKKGYVATEIEREISTFDEFQKKAYINEIIGPERIRGLAGSGKTVVLALKAALTHLRNPDANIAYTFYTKSLYQHIQRLITRFYRQYDDKDPDWNKLKIIHAWGSNTNSGIYHEACEVNKIPFLSFSDANFKKPGNAFDFACSTALENDISEIYDYIFIDEGQDFPESFIKLCLSLCKNGRIVWAYDELQTIFQTKTPSIESVLAGSKYQGLEEDIILYKCYRNPREILVTAHAIGFGFYNEIVQIIKEKEYWHDIGYQVTEGDFNIGDNIKIERPKQNSLETISKHFSKNEIIQVEAFDDYGKEIIFCCENILNDIKDGLLPEDILVIVVDDRNAKKYLNDIHKVLSENNVKCNNIHSDKFSIKDFSINNHVTLSTIHKAKGNEAYSVYVVGIDALYSLKPSVRERNLMFTALTRAKGWVKISGIGESAKRWKVEIDKAISISPNIEFTYSKEVERALKRDIIETAERKSKQSKILDELLAEMTPEEIMLFLEQRKVKKKL